MKKMEYSEALKLLLELLKKEHPEFAKHPEFMACVTHFLQTPEICPPCMSKEIYQKSIDLFVKKKNKREKQ